MSKKTRNFKDKFNTNENSIRQTKINDNYSLDKYSQRTLKLFVSWILHEVGTEDF